jgi:glycerol-3-phosphate dehydrogenase
MAPDGFSLTRDIEQLAREDFDVLVVGAGIFGACAAWDAACRGLRTAVIDRRDFGSGTSANSYKIVHGGIRYIQHADLLRVRSSCHERTALLRIAPHLVHPLPIVIPTYGRSTSGRPFLGAGMYLYDLLTLDRNLRVQDPARRISFTKLLTKAEVLDRFPGLPSQGLTGATQFSDAQLYNPPRLVLAFLQSAARKGATIANYVNATRLQIEGDQVTCVEARDELTGEHIRIRARAVLLATGPWTDALLGRDPGTRLQQPTTYSRDACFVVPRVFAHPLALAVMGRTRDPDAVMSRPGRHLFVVPWRQYSLVGTWHRVVAPDPDAAALSPAELEAFIAEMNSAYPDLRLDASRVSACNYGLVPFGETQSGDENLSYGKRSLITDHARTHGIRNLVSLIGIRYTMGRGDAARAMRLIARKLGETSRSPPTDELPIHGGDFRSFSSLVSDIRHRAPQLAEDTVTCVASNHGSEARTLLDRYPAECRVLPGSHVLLAEVLNAIDHEMAVNLDDIILRRTDLGTGSLPSPEAMEQCALAAAGRLGWTQSQTAQQLERVYRARPPYLETQSAAVPGSERLAMTSAKSAS